MNCTKAIKAIKLCHGHQMNGNLMCKIISCGSQCYTRYDDSAYIGDEFHDVSSLQHHESIFRECGEGCEAATREYNFCLYILLKFLFRLAKFCSSIFVAPPIFQLLPNPCN